MGERALGLQKLTTKFAPNYRNRGKKKKGGEMGNGFDIVTFFTSRFCFTCKCYKWREKEVGSLETKIPPSAHPPSHSSWPTQGLQRSKGHRKKFSVRTDSSASPWPKSWCLTQRTLSDASTGRREIRNPVKKAFGYEQV